jgi:hypothetical protein
VELRRPHAPARTRPDLQRETIGAGEVHTFLKNEVNLERTNERTNQSIKSIDQSMIQKRKGKEEEREIQEVGK